MRKLLITFFICICINTLKSQPGQLSQDWRSLLEQVSAKLCQEKEAIEENLISLRAYKDILEFSERVKDFCQKFEKKDPLGKYEDFLAWIELFKECHIEIAPFAIWTQNNRFLFASERDALLAVIHAFIKQAQTNQEIKKKIVDRLRTYLEKQGFNFTTGNMKNYSLLSSIVFAIQSKSTNLSSNEEPFSFATSLLLHYKIALEASSNLEEKSYFETQMNKLLESTGFNQETLLQFQPADQLPWAFKLPSQTESDFFTPERARMLFAANITFLSVYILYKIGVFKALVRWYTVSPEAIEHQNIYSKLIKELKVHFSRAYKYSRATSN